MKVKNLILYLQAADPELEIMLVHKLGTEKVDLTGINQVSVQEIEIEHEHQKHTVFCIIDENTRVLPKE
jgi:hypothetical protein